jgi:hypothetical protein
MYNYYYEVYIIIIIIFIIIVINSQVVAQISNITIAKKLLTSVSFILVVL